MQRLIAVSIGLLLLAGCGSSRAPSGWVSGTITYKGQPVNGAALLLYPTSGALGAEVTIPVTQEGTFRAADVPLGEYKIVVQPNPGDPGPSTKGMTPEQLAKMKDQLDKMKTPATITIPEKYKTKDKTDLTVTVTRGEVKLPLELKD
jgi:hypothetical protein